VFGRDDGGDEKGLHWISYSGRLPEHRRTPFDSSSIAYQVLVGNHRSPYFTTAKAANKKAQKRSGSRYYSFIVFRLSEHAVLSIDWPGRLKESDPYIRVVKDLFHLNLAPAMAELLSCWNGSLASEVGLQDKAKRDAPSPLPATAPTIAPDSEPNAARAAHPNPILPS
jgi:hypothetical protein